MEKVAKYLKYGGYVYEYSHAKKNILTYISQPYYKFDDWREDGGILVVQYRPNMFVKHRYLVLHCLTVYEGSGRIKHEDISKESKIAVPYDTETNT